MTSIDPGAALLKSVQATAQAEPALKRAEPRPIDRERPGRDDRQNDFGFALNSAAGVSGPADRMPEATRRDGRRPGAQDDGAGQGAQSVERVVSSRPTEAEAPTEAGGSEEAARPAPQSDKAPGARAQEGPARNGDRPSVQGGSGVSAAPQSGEAAGEAARQDTVLERLAAGAGGERAEVKVEEASVRQAAEALKAALTGKPTGSTSGEVMQTGTKPASGSIHSDTHGDRDLRTTLVLNTAAPQGTEPGTGASPNAGAAEGGRMDAGTGRGTAPGHAEARVVQTVSEEIRGTVVVDGGETLEPLQKGYSVATPRGTRSGPIVSVPAASAEVPADGSVTRNRPVQWVSSGPTREPESAIPGDSVARHGGARATESGPRTPVSSAYSQATASGSDTEVRGQQPGMVAAEGDDGSQPVGRARIAMNPLSSESPARTAAAEGGRSAGDPVGDMARNGSRTEADIRESAAGAGKAGRAGSSSPGVGQSPGTVTGGSVTGSGNPTDAVVDQDASAAPGSRVSTASAGEARPAAKPAPLQPALTTGASGEQGAASQARQAGNVPPGGSTGATAPAEGSVAEVAEKVHADAGSQRAAAEGRNAPSPDPARAGPAIRVDGSAGSSHQNAHAESEAKAPAPPHPANPRVVQDRHEPVASNRVPVGDGVPSPADSARAQGMPVTVASTVGGEGSAVEPTPDPAADQNHGRAAGDPRGAAASGRLEHSPQIASQSAAQASSPVSQAGPDTAAGPRMLDVTEMPEFLPHTLRAAVRDGVREANIRLWPPELGAIKVQLQVNGEMVTARIQAERPDAHALLERMRGALQKGMQESGLTLQRLEIELGGSSAVRATSSSGAGQFERDSDPSQRDSMGSGHGNRDGAPSSFSHESRRHRGPEDGPEAGAGPASPVARAGNRGGRPSGNKAERAGGVDAWA